MPLTFDPNFIDFDEQVTSPSTPDANIVRIYVKSDGKFYRKNDAGVEEEIGNVTEFISALFAEGSAPATPAVGKVIIYAKADGKVYSKDDAGVETLMSGGESRVGLIATGSMSGLSAVIISSIPATYTQLVLSVQARSNNATEDFMTVRVGNGAIDTLATNYARIGLFATGATPSSNGDSGVVANLISNCSIGSATVPNRYSYLHMVLPFYNSGIFKNVHYTHNTSIATSPSDQKFVSGAGYWLTNSIIDTIGIYANASTFATNSTYSLIGIKGS